MWLVHMVKMFLTDIKFEHVLANFEVTLLKVNTMCSDRVAGKITDILDHYFVLRYFS